MFYLLSVIDCNINDIYIVVHYVIYQERWQ